MALSLFDYINYHMDLGNGYYFRLYRSSGNNKLLMLPVKKGPKADKGKVMAHELKIRING